MMRFLFLLLFAATGLLAQPATLDLGSRGRLTLYFPGGWTLSSTDMAGQMTLTAASASGVNASCTLMISFPEQDRFDTKNRLKARVEADGMPLAEGSVERKAVTREFLLATGYGFYCSFTDPELRGKPSQPGNYKVMSMGKIRLAPNVLIDVQIMADGFREKPYQDLLGAIEGMEFTPARG